MCDDVGAAADLPEDVLFGIFSCVSGAADVARCAMTCRRWGRVVAARAAAISRVLPPPGRFLPQLALGFLYQQEKKCGAHQHQLSFVPTTAFASSSRLQHTFHLLDDDNKAAALFHGSRPVASRNGRVVLELRRREDGLTLCVWNPMTGDVSMLPPLSEFPGGYYACGILTDDDLDVPPQRCFFRLLLVYNCRSFTALRSYTSDTGSWGPEGRKPGAKIRDRRLRQLGPAVVLRGVAYWPLLHAAFGVHPCSLDVCLLPYRLRECKADYQLLGVSPDGKSLRYLDVGFIGRTLLCISFVTSQLLGVDYKSTTGGFWDRAIDQHIRVPEIKVTRKTTFKLRWFGEKSGTLLFTVGEEASGGTSAIFALNVATRSLEKLAEGIGYHACTDMCGYEMDYAALLASVACPSLTR